VSEAGISDPTDPEGKWAAVRVKPVEKLEHPVTLAAIKAEPTLQESELIRQSRLSVAELRPGEWRKILAMAKA
jgi:predicted RNA-binding protein with PUA-like domain